MPWSQFQFFFNQDFGHDKSLSELKKLRELDFNSFLIKILVMSTSSPRRRRAQKLPFQFFFNQDFGHALNRDSEYRFSTTYFNSFLIKILVMSRTVESTRSFASQYFNSFLIKILVMLAQREPEVYRLALFQFFFNQDFGHVYKASVHSKVDINLISILF